MRRLILAAVLAAAAGGLARAQAPAPKFAFPLACEIGKTCEVQHYVDRDPGPGTLDYRCGPHTYDGHDGIDIRVPDMKAQARGVAVLAAAAGKVIATRDGVADEFLRPEARASVEKTGCGNRVGIDHGGGWISDYCHMAKGSVRVKTGDTVTAGQPIGRVGLSGLTEFPHLHFSVRHNNQVVDPFAPQPVRAGACPSQAPLWTPAAAAAMAYKRGTILNAGFSDDRELSMAKVEAGGIAAPTAASPWLVAYFRAIDLEAGDVSQIRLTGPDGAVLAEGAQPPLVRWRAQNLHFVGKRRPPAGWPKGEYRAELKVLRGGKPAIARTLVLRL
jgi:hypothetical protein